MRIGMAQELAVAGFGLVLIMLAGRWDSPGMPARYIRKLKLSRGGGCPVVTGPARLDRLVGTRNDMGCDVLASYNFVRFGM